MNMFFKKKQEVAKPTESSNLSVSDILKEASDLGSYLITITTLDKAKEENNLKHYLFRKEFSQDDIIPSIDATLKMLNPKTEPVPTVVIPPKIELKREPLKIAIFTHFNRAPESYSPARAVKNQVKILQKFGHKVTLFVAEDSKLDWDCEMRPLVPKFKREKGIVNEEAKQKMIDMLREQLTSDFDLAISHDLYIQDCKTYREAIKECGVDIPWCHWARSGIAEYIDFNHPRARYVYMNYADAGIFAKHLGVEMDKIRVVFNEKDPSVFNSWDPITTMISNKMRLWEKDIIQTYGVCSTRLDAKGLNSVIAVFGQLKKLGKKVALIVCNSNGRKRLDELQNKIKLASEQYGLDENDFVFTSTLANDEFHIESEVPNRVVSQLLQISNLFVMASAAEVCPNILLEAGIARNLIVVNESLPCLMDFCDSTAVIKYPFSSGRNVDYSGRNEKTLEVLAKQIIGQLESNKNDKMLRHIWRRHNFESVYHGMLEPILYEKV